MFCWPRQPEMVQIYLSALNVTTTRALFMIFSSLWPGVSGRFLQRGLSATFDEGFWIPDFILELKLVR